MGLKVLLLNFPHKIIPKPSSNVFVYSSSIKDKPTLHDFHAVFIDMKSVLNPAFWETSSSAGYVNAVGFSDEELRIFGLEKVKEQIETGE